MKQYWLILAVGICFLGVSCPRQPEPQVVPAPPAQAQEEEHAMPAMVKGIYMTAAVASNPEYRRPLVELIKTTELNALVIDIKTDEGSLSFTPLDPSLQNSVTKNPKYLIADLEEFLAELHKEGVWVIARQFVFQDPYLVQQRPDLAVQTAAGTAWKDYRGVTWLEAGAKDVWDYNARIARDAAAQGFDEIQFDYIRFPSDGPMNTIRYRFYDPAKQEKWEVMKEFFAYMDKEVRQKGIATSADLFGFAYWYRDEDLTIGQRMRDAAPYFTALSPMAYPSHYPARTLGFANPAEHPYEIVAETIKKGDEIMKEWPEITYSTRPWIQDFDIGADYDAKKVRAQIQAVEENGGSGWLLWNARNVYTKEALLP